MTMNPRDNQMALQSRDQSEPDGMAVGSGKIKVTPFRTFLSDQDTFIQNLYFRKNIGKKAGKASGYLFGQKN